ncbi:MAG: SDR family oxidoreductase [Acidobacteriota bacterium]
MSAPVAVVTGGSKGIGRAIALGLLGEGYRVAIAARDPQALGAAQQALATAGEVLAVPGDVRDPQSCQELVARAVAWGGRLDVLVHNAGVGVFKPVAEMTVEEFTEQLHTNLFAAFYLSRAALPHLLQSQGWVIHVASLAARHPFAGGAAYCASKAGLVAFSECLMQEVRQQGVRVAAVLPGSVDTTFAGNPTGASWKLAPEDVAQAVLDLLRFPPRALPSLIELRPARPEKT